MLQYLYQCFNHREPSRNRMGDEVTLYEWRHPVYNPSGHLGLKIHQKDQDYYFSFSPKDAYNIVDIPFSELRKGMTGFIVRDYADETLIWGFRRAWGNDLAQKLTADQVQLMLSYYKKNHPDVPACLDRLTQNVIQDFKHLKDSQLLALAQLFSDEMQKKLRDIGQPNGSQSVLRTLDIQAMLSQIDTFHDDTPQWAPWSGTYSHQPNTFNCASIILTILYAGGMNDLLTTRATQWGVAGGLLGFLSLLTTSDPIVVAEFAIGSFCAGRIVGGAQDGYLDIQPFFNMIAGSSHDSCGTVFGLRVLSTLCGGIIGACKLGTTIPAFLCLPEHVVLLAQQAAQTENATHVFNRQARHSLASPV